MQYIDLIGYAAGGIVTLSLIPQTIKSWKTKSTTDLSLGRYAAYTFGLLLWIVYSSIKGDYPLLISTCVSTLLSFSILVMKLKYK